MIRRITIDEGSGVGAQCIRFAEGARGELESFGRKESRMVTKVGHSAHRLRNGPTRND
jgi:hypothetical protein